MGHEQWVMGHSLDGSLGRGSLSLTHCLLWWRIRLMDIRVLLSSDIDRSNWHGRSRTRSATTTLRIATLTVDILVLALKVWLVCDLLVNDTTRRYSYKSNPYQTTWTAMSPWHRIGLLIVNLHRYVCYNDQRQVKWCSITMFGEKPVDGSKIRRYH